MNYMLLKPRIMDPRRKDDITDALMKASGMIKEGKETPPAPGYMVPWYPDGLRDRTLGPHHRKLVPITRYYPTLKVAVDFEPLPPDKWFHDEKLKLCCERGIVYIPIALQDKLTEGQFIARVNDARHILSRAKAELEETKVQQDAVPEDGLIWVEQELLDPELQLAIQRLSIRQAEAERDPLNRPYGGAILRRKIGKYAVKLQEECRRKLRGSHGRTDARKCARELESETERLAEGQVRPPSTDGPGA